MQRKNASILPAVINPEAALAAQYLQAANRHSCKRHCAIRLARAYRDAGFLMMAEKCDARARCHGESWLHCLAQAERHGAQLR